MPKLRIGISRFWHESNSFSCLNTQISDFQTYQGGLLKGAQLLHHHERRDEIAGMIEVLSQHRDAEMVPLVSAGALPSGPICEDAAHLLTETLRKQLKQAGSLDGVCIALHGAMSATHFADLDGHLLSVLREHLGTSIPIVVALDCHAVVTRQMIDLATAMVAYRTHPHVDIVETGARAAKLLMDTLARKILPVARYRRIPMIFPPPDDGTAAGPLKRLFDTFIGWDSLENVVAGSLCPGFAWQDVPEQGAMAMVVTNGDELLADRLVDELAEQLWAARHELSPAPMLSPEIALQRAAKIDGAPVVITDSADTVGGGAPGDNTTLLRTAIAHRAIVDGIILAHLPDEDAISKIQDAQVGQQVTVAVGGKRDHRFCEPLQVTCEVLCVTEGPIMDDFNTADQPTLETGKIICLGVDNVRLVLSERVILGPQPSLFRKDGIESLEAKIVLLKTGVGFKKTYASHAKAVLLADCPGAQSYRLQNYEFKKIPRPMFPMDESFSWQP